MLVLAANSALASSAARDCSLSVAADACAYWYRQTAFTSTTSFCLLSVHISLLFRRFLPRSEARLLFSQSAVMLRLVDGVLSVLACSVPVLCLQRLYQRSLAMVQHVALLRCLRFLGARFVTSVRTAGWRKRHSLPFSSVNNTSFVSPPSRTPSVAAERSLEDRSFGGKVFTLQYARGRSTLASLVITGVFMLHCAGADSGPCRGAHATLRSGISLHSCASRPFSVALYCWMVTL